MMEREYITKTDLMHELHNLSSMIYDRLRKLDDYYYSKIAEHERWIMELNDYMNNVKGINDSSDE